MQATSPEAMPSPGTAETVSSATPYAVNDCVHTSHHDRRDVVVIIGLRCGIEQPERLRNARAVLRALHHQSLARWRYRIVVVEQDIHPRLPQELAPFYDQYVFTYNRGPYNRGWAFNVGAMLPGSQSGALCLLDGDLLVTYDFLHAGLMALTAGAQAVHPFTEIVYLDESQTQRAIADLHFCTEAAFQTWRYSGQCYRGCVGGGLWVDAALYRHIGGHDERFRGWGEEDLEFWQRLSAITTIIRLPGRQLHLYHPPGPPIEQHHNLRLMACIRAGQAQRAGARIGRQDLYTTEAQQEANQP